MKFRKSTSFNSFDTSVSSPEGDRHVVQHDVVKRCNATFTYMVKQVPKLRKMLLQGGDRTFTPVECCLISQEEIVNHMQWLNPTFKKSDVVYAINKLIKEGFVRKSDEPSHSQLYYLVHDPLHVQIRFK